MTKTKRKAKQQNFLQYVLNEFVFFRRDFTFITHLSPEETARNLRQLSYEKQGCWRQRRIIAETYTSRSQISFEVKSERPNKRRYSQSAKATGTIFADDDGTTVVEGSVKMGGLAYWLGVLMLLGFMVFISTMTNSIDAPFLLTLYGAILIFIWVGMYLDRNYLVNIIEQAVGSEKAKTWA